MKEEAKNLFGDSNIHYLGQEKSNSLRGSTEVVNIHYLGQIQNLGQNIITRIEVRTRLAVFTNRQCERDNGRLSVNSLAVIQIIRQAGVLLSKQ